MGISPDPVAIVDAAPQAGAAGPGAGGAAAGHVVGERAADKGERGPNDVLDAAADAAAVGRVVGDDRVSATAGLVAGERAVQPRSASGRSRSGCRHRSLAEPLALVPFAPGPLTAWLPVSVELLRVMVARPTGDDRRRSPVRRSAHPPRPRRPRCQ